MEEKSTGIEDNSVGIAAYITLIGFIIAIVLNGNKTGEEKKFGAFHLRQALGLIIFSIGAYIALVIVTIIIVKISWVLVSIISLLSLFLWLGILALVIVGIVNAVNKTKKELPVIGKFSEKLLGSAFE